MQHFDVFWTDRDGNILGPVTGREETLSITMNADGEYKTAATMEVHDLPGWVNPYKHRVRVDRDGATVATFVIDSDVPKTVRTNRSVILELIDPLIMVGVKKLTKPVTVKQGANITETVAGMIRGLGETRLAVTPSSSALLAPQVWMPGEHTWMNVINDLLTAANYWGLHTNAEGQFVLAPYVLPEDRPVKHEFVAGDGSKLVGEYEEARDYWTVPNRFIATCDNYVPEGSEADPVTLIGVAENRNPASPFSYQARNNTWVDAGDTVEATSQKDIDGIAARRLAAITGGGDYVSVQHLPISGLTLNDLVYVSTAAGDVFHATVNEMSIPEHGLVSAKWKRVVSLGGDV